MKESAKGTVWVYSRVYPLGNNWSYGGRGGKVDRLVRTRRLARGWRLSGESTGSTRNDTRRGSPRESHWQRGLPRGPHQPPQGQPASNNLEGECMRWVANQGVDEGNDVGLPMGNGATPVTPRPTSWETAGRGRCPRAQRSQRFKERVATPGNPANQRVHQ